MNFSSNCNVATPQQKAIEYHLSLSEAQQRDTIRPVDTIQDTVNNKKDFCSKDNNCENYHESPLQLEKRDFNYISSKEKRQLKIKKELIQEW